MTAVSFTAPEYQADGSVRPAEYRFEGSPSRGWRIHREGHPHLESGPGYRLLRTSHCGVCATDLARRFLPFPLPQITGHEVVAIDPESGTPVVVEINASCRARALPPCTTCRRGLPTHCPRRRVLGIHDLPGGFGPWILAPIAAVLSLPEGLAPLAATFTEPFAAAWHAVETVAPRAGDRVLVFGAGRLGCLLVAALAAYRARTGRDLEIVAVARRAESRARAHRLGADGTVDPDAAGAADVVIEASGAPDAMGRALALARRELHLKTTSGKPALGLADPTALVVDELSITGRDAGAARGKRMVRSAAEIDAALRGDVAASHPGPRGTFVAAPDADRSSPLLAAVLERGLRVTSSRCGDFRPALELLASGGLGERIAAVLVTHVLPAARLAEAFALAASGGRKVIVRQEGALL